MKKIILFLCIFMVGVTAVSGLVNVTNATIGTEYFGGSSITGTVEMSIESEPTTSILSDTEGTSMTLIKFLDKVNYDYSCSPSDCGTSYSSSSEVSGNEITLSPGQSKVFGLKYVGNVQDVTSVSFSITSDANESENNQLKIDILDDGTFEVGNINSVEITTAKKMGCFPQDSGANVVQVGIDNVNPFCQRIKLDESPGLKIGAWVKNENPSDVEGINMSIHLLSGDDRGECLIPANTISSEGSFVSCSVDFLIPDEEEYYICVKKNDAAADYKTIGANPRDSSEECGFQGIPDASSEIASYEIGVEQKKFGKFGTLNVENTLQDSSTISSLIKGYLNSQYNSECSASSPCYAPIKIKSSESQTITIDSISSTYNSIGTTTSNEIYEIVPTSATITASKNTFSIDDIFPIKDTPGLRTYAWTISPSVLFSTKINIKTGDFELSKNVAISGEPTEFKIESDINDTIESYSWDFGDNSTIEETSIPSIIHTYKEIGEFKLIVEFTDEAGNILSKEFTINVDSAKNSFDTELNRAKVSLNSMKSVKLALTENEKAILLKSVDIDDLIVKVEQIELELGSSPSVDRYATSLEELLLLEIPEGLTKSNYESVPFFPLINEIDVEVLRDITGEFDARGSDQEIKNAIAMWGKTGIKVSMQENELSLNWKNKDEVLSKSFKLDFTRMSQVDEYYFIFDNTILSSDDPDVVPGINSKSYIPISKLKTVFLSTEMDVKFSDLPVVVSPKISDLNIVSTDIEEIEPPINKTMWTFIGILFAILIGIAIYMGLKYWYRVKYEKYLFKDRNNLYNVMLYVNKSIEAGVPVHEIRESLKKSGWTSEQIRYILRKYEGRETGMPGFGASTKKVYTKTNPKNTGKNMFQDRKYKP